MVNGVVCVWMPVGALDCFVVNVCDSLFDLRGLEGAEEDEVVFFAECNRMCSVLEWVVVDVLLALSEDTWADEVCFVFLSVL